MSKKSKSNSFLIQGSILAVAGILVRVIGLLYRIPLNRILGDVGLGYYGTAFDFYNILILLSSQSMTLAVSKIISHLLLLHQHCGLRFSECEYEFYPRRFLTSGFPL